MKTSELIKFLQKSLEEDGDLFVVSVDFEVGGFYPVDSLRVIDDEFMDDNDLKDGMTGKNIYIGFKIEP